MKIVEKKISINIQWFNVGQVEQPFQKILNTNVLISLVSCGKDKKYVKKLEKTQ